MKLAERMTVARELETIARESGARAVIAAQGIGGGVRETTFHAHWPLLSLSLDIGGPLAPGVLVSFYRAQRDLRPSYWGFDSVNTCHFRKATAWRAQGGLPFVSWFRQVCADIAADNVFNPTKDTQA